MAMGFDFKGRRVVVAGGSRGIGRSIALGFAAAGADVSICARGAGTLEATRAEIARHGRRAHAATCDLADGPAVARYVAEAEAALGGIDVLVNNASGFGMADDEAGWAAGLSVDVMAMVRASHAARVRRSSTSPRSPGCAPPCARPPMPP
jgi:3-oxoacyl-[acyl-carrier protein] reductase